MSSIAYQLPAPATRPPLVLVPGIPRTAPSVFWRRRAVALVVLFFLFAGLYSVVSAALTQVTGVGSEPQPIVAVSAPVDAQVAVTVGPGDTLWSIVSAARPGDDPRPLVAKLSKARHGAPLQIGERITIPSKG